MIAEIILLLLICYIMVFFGVGNNVNYAYLKTEGLFYTHPYSISYSKEDFIKILEKGKTNVQNVIID